MQITDLEVKAFKKVLVDFTEEKIHEMMTYMDELLGADGFNPVYRKPDGSLKVHIVTSFPKVRKWGASRAGVHFSQSMGKQMWIRMNLYHHLLCFINTYRGHTNGIYSMTEYAHIKDHPVIGEMKSAHWTKCLMGVIAHEVAHMVEYGICEWGSWRRKEDFFNQKFTGITEMEVINKDRKVGRKRVAGHGMVFQTIYGILRKKFVNPTSEWILPDPMKTKVRTRKTQWVIKRDGQRARYWSAKDGLFAGSIWTNSFKCEDETNYEVTGRNHQTIGWCATIGEARKLLEENVSLFRTEGVEVPECEYRSRFAA